MANTTEMDGKFISITLDGATDWDLTTVMPNYLSQGLFVKSINVYAATTVVIICRNTKVANATSPRIFHFVSKDTAQLCMQYTFGEGSWMFPAFDDADCGAGEVCIELA